MSEYKGKFIVFDGIDGCGKTTQLVKLIDFIRANEKYKKFQMVYAKEPTYDSKAGLLLRKKLKEGEDPRKEGRFFCKLMIEDRAQHCRDLILPALRHGCIVLCDRYSYSTFAYQQVQGIPFEEILAEHRRYRILKPDLSLIFDVPAAVAIKRIEKSRDKKELFEKVKFLEEVRQNYLSINRFLKDRIIILDNTKPIDRTFEEVKKEFERLF